MSDARNNPMHDAIRIFARGRDSRSLYERHHFEICEGTEGLTDEECKEIVNGWCADERADYGCVVTDYFIR